MNKIGTTGQSLMELVVGIGLVVVVAGAIAITTIQSLQNTQFAKNQVDATKKAQESIEKVRTIKNSNYGVCTEQNIAQGAATCSTWEDIWTTNFGTGINCLNGCTFVLDNDGCAIAGGTAPFCLSYSASRGDLGNGFTGQITIQNEADLQKRITSKVYWKDATGEHESSLITIFSRLNTTQ